MNPLNIEQLSFWERKTYFEDNEFVVIGAGIVGLSTAIELRNVHPTAKILLLERGFLPSGASTKNAGFTCFGSVTELLDDLTNSSEEQVFSTVKKRWDGLQNLKRIVGEENIDLEINGSWDLILPDQANELDLIREKLPYLNSQLEKITGEKDVFSEDTDCAEKFGFEGLKTSFYNRLEGQINTGKLVTKLYQIAIEKGVNCLFGIEAIALQTHLYNVGIQTSIGYMKARNVLICTNGFAQQFIPNRDILPARAQVLVTTPIEDLKVKGTFHYQQGYYYFRNVEDRILLGGGRNLNFAAETTTQLETSEEIMTALEKLLSTVILPNQPYSIEYQWAGIMGIGLSKAPIIEKIDDKIGIGVRMGGMGVAIGTLVGKELAELFR
jgi:gamma-glutamylputrescine oxidase